jgi:hypothetical protein
MRSILVAIWDQELASHPLDFSAPRFSWLRDSNATIALITATADGFNDSLATG